MKKLLIFPILLCIISLTEIFRKGQIMNTVDFAKKMRRLILDEIYYAQSGHPGGSLSVTDIVADR